MRRQHDTVRPTATLLLLLLMAASGIWRTKALSAVDRNALRLLQLVSGTSRALRSSPASPGPAPAPEPQTTGIVSSAGQCPLLPGTPNVANGVPVLDAAMRYPYMVSLRTHNVPWARPGNPGHYCAGTLIAQNLVLTAAHCIFEKPSNGDPPGLWHPDYNATKNKSPDGLSLIEFPTAVIGASCTAGVGTDSVPVTKVLIHPDFTGDPNNGFDVGIMQLKRSVSPPVTPIALNKEPSDMLNLPSKDVPPGDTLQIIGYGAQTSGGGPSTILKAANVSLASFENCARSFPSIFRSQLCTSTIGTNTCQGDSGGPLLVTRDTNPQHDIQVGIISFGPPIACGGPSGNSVYSRVASFTSEAATASGYVPDPNHSDIDDWIGALLTSLGVQAPVMLPPQPPPLLPATVPVLASPAASPSTTSQQNETTCFTVPGQVNIGDPVTNAAVRFPYVVSLQTVNPPYGSPGSPGHYCDGTLIAQNLVLTAAQCIFDNSQGRTWTPGFNSRTNIAPNGSFIDYPTAVIGSPCSAGPGIDSIPVSKAIIHPNFTGNINDGYDAAILILQRPAKPEAIPVKLDAGALLNLPAMKLPQESQLTLLGYGPLLSTSGDSTLNAAHVSLISRGQCSAAYAPSYLSQLCAYGVCKSTDKPVGYPGEPLIVTQDGSPANDIQVGIYTFYAADNRTAAFTRIASYNAQAVSSSATASNADQLNVDNWISDTIAKYNTSGGKGTATGS